MENRSVKALLPLLLLLGGCSAVGHQWRHITGNAQARLADDVVIERDAWGVPHIYGRSDAATAFGAAWAMAEDDFRGVEESYIEALGRSAYYYGARYLADDLVRAAFRVEALARAEYAREPESGRRLLDAFAQGLNYWVRKHPEVAPRVVTHFEGWMVLACARTLSADQQFGGVRLGEIAVLAGEPTAGSRSRLAAGPGAAWAIAPARSASRRALLLASMARPFFGGAQPYELELRSEEGWHVYGFAALGTPEPYTGHNEQLGWGHARVADSAVVQPLVFGNPADSLAYQVAGRWERAESWLDTIAVNTAGGVEPRVYRFVRTPYGPVVARRGDTAYAVLLAGLEAGGALQQWHAMGRARNLAEFTAALKRGALPGWATVYADADGNILADPGTGGEPVVNPAVGEVRAAGSRAVRLLLPDSGWSPASLTRIALGTAPLDAAAEVAQLVHEWEEVGGRNSRRAFAMDSAVELLRRWNGTTGAVPPGTGPPGDNPAPLAADSASGAAATLYYVWQEGYRASTASAGSRAGGGAAVAFPRFQALEEAVAGLRQTWGRLAVPWGEAVRLQRPAGTGGELRDEAPSIPVAGFPDGSLFVLNVVPGNARRRYAASGTAAVMITEFAVQAHTASVVVFGQSADPASPHYFDQAVRYGAGELKEAPSGSGPSGPGRYHPGQGVRGGVPETSAR